MVRDALSNRTAAPIPPGEAVSADAATRHHHDRGPLDYTRSNHDSAAIGAASAIGTSMETWAASAGGIGGAKARNRARHQSCYEKIPHVFSL